MTILIKCQQTRRPFYGARVTITQFHIKNQIIINHHKYEIDQFRNNNKKNNKNNNKTLIYQNLDSLYFLRTLFSVIE